MSHPRFATIDIGTNSVLLLVAERSPTGFNPILERAEITRLGRGVDRTGELSVEGLTDTLKCLVDFVGSARSLGALKIAVTATSAARDAKNGRTLIERAKSEIGVEIEILSGDLEAELSFAAAWADFQHLHGPVTVLDIGGGSTEVIDGDERGRIRFRKSFDVGSVRLTERFVHGDVVTQAKIKAIEDALIEQLSALPPREPGAALIGVAGTVTTLYAVLHRIEPYDSAAVQGGTLSLEEVIRLADQLCGLCLEERKRLPGMQPKRADVIPAGALILKRAMIALKADACRVSDRGLRWGLLRHRFG